MYHMTKKNIDQLLDVLDENLMVTMVTNKGRGGDEAGPRGAFAPKNR